MTNPKKDQASESLDVNEPFEMELTPQELKALGLPVSSDAPIETEMKAEADSEVEMTIEAGQSESFVDQDVSDMMLETSFVDEGDEESSGDIAPQDEREEIEAAELDPAQMSLGEGSEELSEEEREMLGLNDSPTPVEADDEDAPPQTFVEHSQLISITESLLFATDRPLTVAAIHGIFKGTNIKPSHVRKALDELMASYADAYRGVTLEEVQGGYQLRTKLDNAEFIKRVSKVRPFKLSGPSLETLAIIAYKQPITKSDVDQIRGVESGHLVRALMERNLVQFQGKSDLPGRPMFYGTTKKFLDIFGLRNLNELPTLSEIDELIPEGIGAEAEEKPKLADLTDSMSEEVKGSYSEGEEELGKITDQLNAITTSSDFFEEEKRRQKEKRDFDRAQDIREALTLGDLVEDKDRKWLERYDREVEEKRLAEEARLEAQTQSAQAAIVESAQVGDLLLTETSEDKTQVHQSLARWQREDELEVFRFEDSDEEEGSESLLAIHSAESSSDDDEVSDDELDAFLGYSDEENGTDKDRDPEAQV